MSTDIERAIEDLVAIGIIESDIPRHELTDLVVTNARSLEGIEACTGLETLSLIGCSIGDYAPLSRLRSLRVLGIENSDLVDTGWASELQLQVVEIRRNRVRDAMPIIELPTLQVLDLSGNPLSDESRNAAASLRPGRLVTLDDDETAELNVRLAEAGTGIVAYRVGEDLRACATGLDRVAHPEAGHVATSRDALEDVIRGVLSPLRLLGRE